MINRFPLLLNTMKLVTFFNFIIVYASLIYQIRKAAQLGVCSVLKGSEFMFSDSPPAHHPAAQSTAKFCIQEIEKSGGKHSGG